VIRKKNGEVEWLEFELLADMPLQHGVFLRHGGVSKGTFGSLNAGGLRGDTAENIEENRWRIQTVLGLEVIKGCNQVHADHVMLVTDPAQVLPDGDGLMTQQRALGLMVLHADCQGTIFYDPVQHAVSVVHAGWRGNVRNIYAGTVARMGREFGSRPEDLLVAISPSLGPDRSEFINYRTELPESFWRFQFKPTYFDLWAISRHQLEEAGVRPEHIQIAAMCTYDRPEDFFSFRRDKTPGNHATIAALK